MRCAGGKPPTCVCGVPCPCVPVSLHPRMAMFGQKRLKLALQATNFRRLYAARHEVAVIGVLQVQDLAIPLLDEGHVKHLELRVLKELEHVHVGHSLGWWGLLLLLVLLLLVVLLVLVQVLALLVLVLVLALLLLVLRLLRLVLLRRLLLLVLLLVRPVLRWRPLLLLLLLMRPLLLLLLRPLLLLLLGGRRDFRDKARRAKPVDPRVRLEGSI